MDIQAWFKWKDFKVSYSDQLWMCTFVKGEIEDKKSFAYERDSV